MQLKWPMLWNFFSLFPAYAGVIRKGEKGSCTLVALPRIRGGDPEKMDQLKDTIGSSPHTRG